MSYSLFIDDERFPPNDGQDWRIARHFDEVADILTEFGSPTFVSFDHDLGDHTPSGFDIAKAMVEGDMNARSAEQPRGPVLPFAFPDGFAFYVHSQNPVGKRNIQEYLDSYLGQIQA